MVLPPPPILIPPSGSEKSSGLLPFFVSFLAFFDNPSSEISLLSGSDDFSGDLAAAISSASSKSPKSSVSAAGTVDMVGMGC